jgi:hypothetical protein
LDLEQNGIERQIVLARLLVTRLERLSADSYWAHQASGVRGSLLRALEQVSYGGFTPPAADTAGLENRLLALNEKGYTILVRAAIEKAPQRPGTFLDPRRLG